MNSRFKHISALKFYFTFLNYFNMTRNRLREILLDYNKMPNLIPFKHLIENLVESLLSHIISSFSPSKKFNNCQYSKALNIIKLLKYMCEEQNMRFQTLLFKELKFDLIVDVTDPDNSKVIKSTLFDFMLRVACKIVQLSKWKKLNFENNKVYSNYFFDAFSLLWSF